MDTFYLLLLDRSGRQILLVLHSKMAIVTFIGAYCISLLPLSTPPCTIKSACLSPSRLSFRNIIGPLTGSLKIAVVTVCPLKSTFFGRIYFLCECIALTTTKSSSIYSEGLVCKELDSHKDRGRFEPVPELWTMRLRRTDGV